MASSKYIKYIAEGFQADSEKLLKDFVEKNSTNFTSFATIWKQHNFGLIYLGRNKQELQQFTHEIYQLTLRYLLDGSFMLQVGAVYLLYALYRNQIATPPVRIRLVLSQWEIIKKLKVIAEKNCYIHLHYVIDFMYRNSFDFVAYGFLHGPLSSKGNMETEKSSLHNTPVLFKHKHSRGDMTDFFHDKGLEELEQLTRKYANIGKKINLPMDERFDGSRTTEFNNWLSSLVTTGTYSKSKYGGNVNNDSLGARRAKIKANQFKKKASFKQLNPSDSDEEYAMPVKHKGKRSIRTSLSAKPQKLNAKRKIGSSKKTNDTVPLKEELLDSSDESDQEMKSREHRKRGPSIRPGYLNEYELNLSVNQTMVRKLLGYTSEMDLSDSNEEDIDSPTVCSEFEIGGKEPKIEISNDDLDNSEKQNNEKDVDSDSSVNVDSLKINEDPPKSDSSN